MVGRRYKKTLNLLGKEISSDANSSIKYEN
jgi:hypothetical protein